MKTNPHIFGITGWSGSGKTHLVVRLIPELRRRGFRVSTVKHAHHTFDVDQPGKDSFEHRTAGASEVMISSARRWALLHENIDDPESCLESLLDLMSPTDIVLVEGFKDEPHQKIEVYRAAVEADPICRTNRSIIAVASDGGFDGVDIPVIDLNDTAAIADFIVDRIGGGAEPLRGAI